MLRETLNKRVFLKIFRKWDTRCPAPRSGPRGRGSRNYTAKQGKLENPTLRLLQLLLFTFLTHGGIIKT